MVDVKGLVGTRFINGGRDKGTGLDCWGLVMEVFRRYGVEVPDFTVDSFAFDKIDALAGEAAESRTWEEVYTPSDTDAPLVVLMRMHPGLINHAGVYIGGNRIIHTMQCVNAVLSRVDALESRIAGYYRPCSE